MRTGLTPQVNRMNPYQDHGYAPIPVGVIAKCTRPNIIDDLEASGQIFPTPSTVTQILREGGNEHIPFPALTNKYVSHSALQQQTPLKELHNAEYSLTYAEWIQASGRFICLIKQYFSDRVFRKWDAHFDRIANKEGVSLDWDVHLRYDILVRRQSLSQGLDPKKHHTALWEKAQTESFRIKTKARINSAHRSHEKHRSDPSPAYNRKRRFQGEHEPYRSPQRPREHESYRDRDPSWNNRFDYPNHDAYTGHRDQYRSHQYSPYGLNNPRKLSWPRDPYQRDP